MDDYIALQQPLTQWPEQGQGEDGMHSLQTYVRQCQLVHTWMHQMLQWC